MLSPSEIQRVEVLVGMEIPTNLVSAGASVAAVAPHAASTRDMTTSRKLIVLKRNIFFSPYEYLYFSSREFQYDTSSHTRYLLGRLITSPGVLISKIKVLPCGRSHFIAINTPPSFSFYP